MLRSPRLHFVTLGLLFAANARTAEPESTLPWGTLEPTLRAYVASERAPGLVIAIRTRQGSDVRGYGTYAPGDERKIDGETLFEIGSVSKVFTGILLADAVARNLVKLDDPLRSFAPQDIHVPDQKAPEITLEHLATHSSALPRMPPNFAPKDPANPYADYDADRMWEGLDRSVIGRAPGSKYEYSNFAVGLLGEILIAKNGAANYDALLERITQPLGMTSTRCRLDQRDLARLALPHRADLVADANWDLNAFAGAGGIRSSGKDMLRFVDAVLNAGDDALGSAIRSAIEPRFRDPKSNVGVGLCWHMGDGDVVWHNGQTGGYHSFVGVSRQNGVAVVALANSAAGELDELGNWCLVRLLGIDKQAPEYTGAVIVPDAQLEKLVGRYNLGLFAIIEVTFEKDGKTRPRGLYAKLADQPALRLFAKSPTEFSYRGVPASITFEEIEANAGVLVLHQNGQDQRAKRIVK